MPYLVTVHQTARLVVEFTDADDFRRWEDAGACLSDLPPSAVISDRTTTDLDPHDWEDDGDCLPDLPPPAFISEQTPHAEA